MEQPEITEEKKERNWKNYFRLLLISFAVYFVFSIIIFSYLTTQNQRFVLEKEQASFLSELTVTPTPTLTPTHAPAPENWAVYKNNKYGFSIRYPHGLTFKEEDTEQWREKRRQYDIECQKPGAECGGTRAGWPDSSVSFYTADNEDVFDINIYFVPIIDNFVGKPSQDVTFGVSSASKSGPPSQPNYLWYGVEKEGLSYWYNALTKNIYSLNTLEKIAESFKFIPSQKPLKCFSHPESDNSDNTEKTISGYFYNQEKNSCQSIEVIVDDSPRYSIPFSSQADCENICLNK